MRVSLIFAGVLAACAAEATGPLYDRPFWEWPEVPGVSVKTHTTVQGHTLRLPEVPDVFLTFEGNGMDGRLARVNLYLEQSTGRLADLGKFASYAHLASITFQFDQTMENARAFWQSPFYLDESFGLNKLARVSGRDYFYECERRTLSNGVATVRSCEITVAGKMGGLIRVSVFVPDQERAPTPEKLAAYLDTKLAELFKIEASFMTGAPQKQ